MFLSKPLQLLTHCTIQAKVMKQLTRAISLSFRCGLSLPDDTVFILEFNVGTLNPTTNGCHLK